MSAKLETKYEQLRKLLGKAHTERLGVVSQRDLDRFAVASHSPGVASHPLFLSSVMGWGAGPQEDELDLDGTSPEATRGLRVGDVRLMGAGQDLEFHAQVQAGTAVVVHTCLADIQLKRGRSGSLLVLCLRRRFTDDTDQPLVTCRESFIAR